MAIASAPAKVILFGEHSVVYGRHAVVTAVDLRCYVEAVRANDFTISSPLGTTGIDFEVHPYISHAIRRFMEIRKIDGVRINVYSEIPIASGLGSSASVTVAVLKALCLEFGVDLSEDEIFELGRRVELDVQGIGSGTDPFIVTFGGTWVIPDRRKLNANIELLVVNTGEKSITAEMVRKVAELRRRHEDIVERIFDVMDSIALRGVEAIERGDMETLGTLFFLNQCMLRALGVSTPKIEEVIRELEEKGVFAKITGAGGGGCVIGVGNVKNVGKGFVVTSGAEGVREESSLPRFTMHERRCDEVGYSQRFGNLTL